MSRDKVWTEYPKESYEVSSDVVSTVAAKRVNDLVKMYGIDQCIDEVAVEALEDELDAELEQELANWLKSSDAKVAGSHREMHQELEILNQLRQNLKKSDEVSLPESGVYFDALEKRIMGALDVAIESGEVENREVPARQVTPMPVSVAAQVAKQVKVRRRAMAMRAGQFAVLAGVTMLMAGKWLVRPQAPTSLSNAKGVAARQPMGVASEVSAADQLRATHQAAPKVLTGTVMSFESDSDLALEIAARRLVAYHKGE